MVRLSREVAMELEKRRVRKAVLSGKEEDTSLKAKNNTELSSKKPLTNSAVCGKIIRLSARWQRLRLKSEGEYIDNCITEIKSK